MLGSAEDNSERTRQLGGGGAAAIRARGTRHPRTHVRRVLWALWVQKIGGATGAEDPRPHK